MAAGNYQGAYSADKVIIVVGGLTLSGGDDGDFVTAEYAEDRATPKVGADGEVGISVNPSKLGTITFTFSASSNANDQLSELVAMDSTFGFRGSIPISVVDLSGRSVITATKSWLQTAPSITFGKEIGSREWVFGCADLSLFAGGNN